MKEPSMVLNNFNERMINVVDYITIAGLKNLENNNSGRVDFADISENYDISAKEIEHYSDIIANMLHKREEVFYINLNKRDFHIFYMPKYCRTDADMNIEGMPGNV